MFKSNTQPYCRMCGKPVRKHTTQHYVEHPMGRGRFDFDAELVTREDLQKRTNQQIVSVKYHYENEEHERASEDIYDNRWTRHVSGRRTVYSYTTWDGESYVGEFFCNGDCAEAMGYSAARAGWSTDHWRRRVKRKETT
jgi:hypothetical protein